MISLDSSSTIDNIEGVTTGQGHHEHFLRPLTPQDPWLQGTDDLGRIPKSYSLFPDYQEDMCTDHQPQ